MDNNKIIIQARKWLITCYKEWNDNFSDIQSLVNWLTLNFNLSTYAVILHDKDIENGSPKKEHYHIYIETKSNIRQSTLMKRFGCNNPFMFDICKNTVATLAYFIHKNNPEKVPYLISEIKTNIKDIETIIQNGLDDEDALFNLLEDYIKSSANVAKITGERMSFRELCIFAKNRGLLRLIIKHSYFIKMYLNL